MRRSEVLLNHRFGADSVLLGHARLFPKVITSYAFQQGVEFTLLHILTIGFNFKVFANLVSHATFCSLFYLPYLLKRLSVGS